jgi:hypothetical protein
MNDMFTQWLNTPAGISVVRKIMGKNTAEMDECDTSFWEMLLRDGKSRTVLTRLVNTQDWDGLKRKINSMYSSYKMESRRDKFYERVRQALSERPTELGYQPQRHYSYYGGDSTTCRVIPSFDELCELGFKPTYRSIEVSTLRESLTLQSLALEFLKSVNKFCKADCCIPVRTFCDYVRSGYSISHLYPPATHSEYPDKYVPEDQDQTIDKIFHGSQKDGWEGDTPGLADYTCRISENWVYTIEQLSQLADSVAYQLEHIKVKQGTLMLLLCLRIYCNLTMEIVSRALGFRSASGINAPMEKATAVIRESTSLYEGLSPDDLDPGMYNVFTGLLFDRCTEADCSQHNRA